MAWEAQVEGLSIRHLGAPFPQARACEQREQGQSTDGRDGSERLLSCLCARTSGWHLGWSGEAEGD